ncbi:MAG: Mur ligase family protein [Terricaulis sp.]
MGEVCDRALAAFEDCFGPEFEHGKTFDLQRLKSALHALGDPQAKIPAPVIHVAGTNGKGSTIAFMRAIAEAAGLRVHAFTKPHLFALRERFVVAGEIVGDEALVGAARRVAAVSTQITHFDAQIAAALLLFSETPADLVLLETGMGGRDDSTNVISSPAASVIAPVGLDHQDVLGDTLTKIAAHKAGILKQHTPAFIARQARDAMAAIEAEAAHVGALLFRCGVEWDSFPSNGRMVVQTETRTLDLPLPGLAGTHQVENAGLACVTFLGTTRYTVSDEAFAAGISSARWPGRLQLLTRGPFSAATRALGGEVWVDGGHNSHAAEALARALRDLSRRRQAPTIAIVGMRARKDSRAFVAALAPAINHIIAVPLADDHAAPEEIATHARSLGVSAEAATTLGVALANAERFAAPRILICGSLTLAAAALSNEDSANSVQAETPPIPG